MVNETIETKVECNRCGDCCRVLHIRMPVSEDADLEAMRLNMMFYWNLHEGVYSDLQRTQEGKIVIHFTVDSKCSMLLEHKDGTTSCKIYPMRPPICRVWPRSSDGVKGPDIPHCSILIKDYKEMAQVRQDKDG